MLEEHVYLPATYSNSDESGWHNRCKLPAAVPVAFLTAVVVGKAATIGSKRQLGHSSPSFCLPSLASTFRLSQPSYQKCCQYVAVQQTVGRKYRYWEVMTPSWN